MTSLYATLDVDCGIRRGGFKMTMWMKNLTGTEYKTFYFETIGATMDDKAGFFQRGKPFHFGVDVAYSF